MTIKYSNPGKTGVQTKHLPVAFVMPTIELNANKGKFVWPETRQDIEQLARVALHGFDVVGMFIRSAQIIYDDEDNTLRIKVGMADMCGAKP